MEDVRYSIMNQQDSTFKFFLLLLPPVVGEVASGRKCLYSVLFCLSGATWAPQTVCALRLTLRFLDFTVSLFPFCSRRRRHRWDESLSLSAAILRNDFLFRWGSALAIQGGDTGRWKTFPPCHPVCQHLFSLVSAYHVKPHPRAGDSTASIAQLG